MVDTQWPTARQRVWTETGPTSVAWEGWRASRHPRLQGSPGSWLGGQAGGRAGGCQVDVQTCTQEG